MDKGGLSKGKEVHFSLEKNIVEFLLSLSFFSFRSVHRCAWKSISEGLVFCPEVIKAKMVLSKTT